MAKHKIIAPDHAKQTFYEYLYRVQSMSKCRDLIPTDYFKDLINYFEEIEDYEKCKELHEYIKDRDDV